MIERNNAGLRTQSATTLKNESTGEVIYTPPQDPAVVRRLMGEWTDFIHQNKELDPLLLMVVAHHQFESIHPFYDGNGRVGRVLNLLILQREGLLELPLLYLSRYITLTKSEYYALLQTTRETGDWVPWCVYMLKGVAITAKSEIKRVNDIHGLMQTTKNKLRDNLPKSYSQDLLNNLFRYPYTKIDWVARNLRVTRITANKYLDKLNDYGIIVKEKIGRGYFYINHPLFALLSNTQLEIQAKDE